MDSQRQSSNSSAGNLFIVEAGRGGHQQLYLEHVLAVVDQNRKRFERVFLITWRANVPVPINGIEPVWLDGVSGPVTRFCLEKFAEMGVHAKDTVFLTEGDRVLSLPVRVWLRFHCSIAFIWFKPNFFLSALGTGSIAYRVRTGLKWIFALFLAVSGQNIRVGHIDLPNFRVARRLGIRAFYLPDPLPERFRDLIDEAVHKVSTSEELVLLSIGYLDERKGVIETLTALRSLKTETAVRYRIVGAPADAFRATLNKAIADFDNPRVAIDCMPDAVSDAQFVAEIAAADVVMVNYPRFFSSSGIVNFAMYAGKYIVGYDKGVIGYRLAKYSKAVFVDYGSESSVRHAVVRLAQTRQPAARCSAVRSEVPTEAEFQDGVEKLLCTPQ